MARPRSTEDMWRAMLGGTDPVLKFGRSLLQHLPSAPRCKLCNAPFSGFGGRLMKLIGKSPWERNPRYCRFCIAWGPKRGPGGVEVETSLLFADVRGSTSLAARLSPREYGEIINRFYACATEVFVAHDAIIDQLVGDEAIGLFLPGYAGPAHARRAVEAALALVEALAGSVPQLRIGAGVHTGTAFIGSVGSADSFTDFTALGDAVNVAARLAAAAGPGEILVSAAARASAPIPPGAERRALSIKGKAEPIEVFVLRR